MFRIPPVFLLFFVVGCEEAPDVCSEYLAFSATVDVVDENGDPIVATLTATDEEGNAVVARCANGDDSMLCSEWIVGDEVSGTIVIDGEATRECNTGSGSLTVQVPMDEAGCHVVSQTGTLEITEWTDLGCVG